ncbi:MAG: Bor family protein [Balneolales bacterium]|nr:Bor family protein [Balneolales bacterium]
MNKKIALLMLIAGFILAGCYNARITTGAQPSATVIENAWAHSFIGGLVPPSTVNVAQQCPNGVAIVDTKLSFLNMVANAITFGLYSPMHITVTCAAASSSLDLNEQNTIFVSAENKDEVEIAVTEAIRRSSEDKQPIYIKF